MCLVLLRKAEELPYYFADNGVTVKARDWVNIGLRADIDGKTLDWTYGDIARSPIHHEKYFIAVDLPFIKNTLNTYSDLSTQVTTKLEITNKASAAGIFLKTEIKGIENWDISNWTSMYGLFDSDKPVKSDLSYWDVSNVKDFRLAMQLESTNPNINKLGCKQSNKYVWFF